MVTQFKFLNSNPVKGIQKASQIAAVPRFKLGLRKSQMGCCQKLWSLFGSLLYYGTQYLGYPKWTIILTTTQIVLGHSQKGCIETYGMAIGSCKKLAISNCLKLQQPDCWSLIFLQKVGCWCQQVAESSDRGRSYHVLGLYWGYIRAILGLYWDNGKENGNGYLGFRLRDWLLQAVMRKLFRCTRKI